MLNTRTRKSRSYTFTATCASGLEELVAEELVQCGAENATVKPSAISWTAASLESGYRACLWSRFASRILLELARFDAANTDALYEHAGEVLWDEHLHLGKTFAVSCTLVNSAIEHSQFAALRVKDDVMKTVTAVRENCGDIHADARDINEKRAAEKDAKELARAKAIIEAHEAKAEAQAEAAKAEAEPAAEPEA